MNLICKCKSILLNIEFERNTRDRVTQNYKKKNQSNSSVHKLWRILNIRHMTHSRIWTCSNRKLRVIRFHTWHWAVGSANNWFLIYEWVRSWMNVSNSKLKQKIAKTYCNQSVVYEACWLIDYFSFFFFATNTQNGWEGWECDRLYFHIC